MVHDIDKALEHAVNCVGMDGWGGGGGGGALGDVQEGRAGQEGCSGSMQVTSTSLNLSTSVLSSERLMFSRSIISSRWCVPRK